MFAGSSVDRFETINGPEDGTEFAITRAPFDIGSDAGCAVNARLDEEVNRYHARGSVAAKGYRIRSLAGHPVWVNGKRVGRVRSRIAREKDIVRVGRTEFMVHLADGGLASRSFGVPAESDLAYAARSLGRALLGIFGLLRWLYNVRFTRLLFFLVIGTAVLSYFYPPFGQVTMAYLRYGWGWIMHWLYALYFQIAGQV